MIYWIKANTSSRGISIKLSGNTIMSALSPYLNKSLSSSTFSNSESPGQLVGQRLHENFPQLTLTIPEFPWKYFTHFILYYPFDKNVLINEDV